MWIKTSDLCPVAAVIAVGFAGLAVCLTIVCCGVVYLRRCVMDISSISAVIKYGHNEQSFGIITFGENGMYSLCLYIYLSVATNEQTTNSKTVRISSLVYNVTNYYSVTDNIFQLIVDFWHMLLVNDDDDVGFSLTFLYDSAMFCVFKIFYIYFFKYFFVRVGVCMIS